MDNTPVPMINIDKQRRIGELTFKVQMLQTQIQQLRQSIQQSTADPNIIQYTPVLDDAFNTWIKNPGCR